MSCRNRRYLMYIAQNYAYAMLRPLQQKIIEQGGEVRWFLEGKEVSCEYLADDEIQLLTVREVKQWRPDAVFVPGNVVPNFIPGVKIGVFHGFNSGKLNRRGREDHWEIRGCFDMYCTQGPQTTGPFEKLQLQYGFFKVKETGWPALDPLFKTNDLNPYIDREETRPTVLMCSTFSRNLTCAPHLYDEVKRMSESGRWRWLIQFHPKMDQETVELYKGLQGDNLTFVETDNVIPLLQAADVMLCDTSSVLLMFLLQRKPVVTLNNQNPKPHLLNFSDKAQVELMLEKALQHPPELMKSIEEYCQFIHPYQDGESSQRVINAANELVDTGLAGLKRKPMNLLRQLKMRKKLGYWTL